MDYFFDQINPELKLKSSWDFFNLGLIFQLMKKMLRLTLFLSSFLVSINAQYAYHSIWDDGSADRILNLDNSGKNGISVLNELSGTSCSEGRLIIGNYSTVSINQSNAAFYLFTPIDNDAESANSTGDSSIATSISISRPTRMLLSEDAARINRPKEQDVTDNEMVSIASFTTPNEALSSYIINNNSNLSITLLFQTLSGKYAK